MSEKRFKKMDTIIDPFPIWDTVEEKGYNCTDTLDLLVDLLNKMSEENEHLRQMIKENVFQRYREGSLADLEFKAIAYDDIVGVEMPNELEPKVIVYCKQGKKKNIMSYCQMVIPFGVYYEIKEVIGGE